MNSPQEYQTDLEVILEFLEEHYRQESGRKALWNSRDLSITSTTEGEDSCGEKLADEDRLRSVSEQEKSPRQPSTPAAQQVMGSVGRAKESDRYTDCVINNSAHPSSAERDLNALNGPERPLTLNTTLEKSAESLAGITPAEKGKKLRLFHFLFEMLEDPDMADCISWVPASVGVFRFSARHKERVAELWGQRKGNRLPMTYQKMSRAMRNYARSGEIIKVKKKLTYQFSVATLSTLQSQSDIKTAANVRIQMRAE